MAHRELVYGMPERRGFAAAPTVAIYADRADVRCELQGDAMLAGLQPGPAGSLAAVLVDDKAQLADVTLVDCPVVDAAALVALCRLDQRAAQGGQALIVSTSVAGLDDVFGCLDQSQAQILVDPTRGDRLIALGQVLGQRGSARLRDLAAEDRVTLLRLTEQVAQIAERLDRLGLSGPVGERLDHQGFGSVESPRSAFFGAGGQSGDRLVQQVPDFPPAETIRSMIRARMQRAKFFDGALFADPAWDILLDLTAARVERVKVSVTSLCIASGVPPTTALRWIGQMTAAGLLVRNEDRTDRRRVFVGLGDGAAQAMAHYFAAIAPIGPLVV